MIERYGNPKIYQIWSDESKTSRWQEAELAVCRAGAELQRVALDVVENVCNILMSIPINLEWWRKRELELRHDLAAFVEERRRHLPESQQSEFHGHGMTSYDAEDPAFVSMLKQSVDVVEPMLVTLEQVFRELALKHRYTIMNGRTHGMEAELQSFGKRVLTWIAEFRVARAVLTHAKENLKYGKLSGAVGNYGGVDPELEREALAELGLEPFYGATQILPRILFKPLADSLEGITLVLAKIAWDIRLGSRSGRPIYQEPFGKDQKGSSAMPHKKNPITTEQIMGLARIISGLCSGIKWNTITTEERAIEQSCVERVNWPDMFHTLIQALKGLTRVIAGLQVFPDNMLLEVVDSRGTYASAIAKDVLAELCREHGITADECYRAVQLAAFNAFELPEVWQGLRDSEIANFGAADAVLSGAADLSRPRVVSIQTLIARGQLKSSPSLGIEQADVTRWNGILRAVFLDSEALRRWNETFRPSYLLRNEHVLYEQVLGVE
ncbi:MAG: lyase family protein [bacterium]|nr:lyase family protein [bacterium]